MLIRLIIDHGTVYIINGNIIGEKYTPISNKGTLIIGTKDGNVNVNTPIVRGAKTPAGSNYNKAIAESGDIYIYDGILKSIGSPIANINKVKDVETGYSLVNSTETIDNTTFKITYLAQ